MLNTNISSATVLRSRPLDTGASYTTSWARAPQVHSDYFWMARLSIRHQLVIKHQTARTKRLGQDEVRKPGLISVEVRFEIGPRSAIDLIHLNVSDFSTKRAVQHLVKPPMTDLLSAFHIRGES